MLTKVPNSLWIVDSSIELSETFLLQSLDNHRAISEVTPVSGGLKPDAFVAGVRYTGFVRKKYKVWHRLFLKIWGIDLVEKKKRKHASKEIEELVKKNRFLYAWIHFGTTVPYVCPPLQEYSIPFFIQVHGADVTSRFRNKAYKKAFISWANLSQAVVCNSEHVRRMLVLAGVLEDRVVVVRNALNVEGLSAYRVQKTEFPSLIHLGRLTQKKHPIATLIAFKIVIEHYPEARLTFIGDGPLRDELFNRIRLEGLEESTEILGPMDHESALAEVAKSWIFCQHSVTSDEGDQEGFPNSLAEAALLGLPVVSTFHNGIPENVLDGETGFLVKEFDFESMAERMIRLIQSSELRQQMGCKGRERIQSLCEPEMRVKALKALFHSTGILN